MRLILSCLSALIASCEKVEQEYAFGIVYHETMGVLLMQAKKSKQKVYQIPGGHIDGNETPKEAMQREFLEETGITIPIDRFTPVEIDGDTNIYKHRHFFSWQITDEEASSIALSHEHIGYTFENIGRDAFADAIVDHSGGHNSEAVSRMKLGVRVYVFLKNDDGKVLLLEHKNRGKYQLPGGRVIAGNSVKKSLALKIREETYIDLIDQTSRLQLISSDGSHLFYEATISDQQFFRMQLSSEHVGSMFYDGDAAAVVTAMQSENKGIAKEDAEQFIWVKADEEEIIDHGWVSYSDGSSRSNVAFAFTFAIITLLI